MEVRKNLYLIFKEATNNMVKYAGANKAIFTIKNKNDNLSMLIRDNGQGFDINKSTEGNGLKNMRKRAQSTIKTIPIWTIGLSRGCELFLVTAFAFLFAIVLCLIYNSWFTTFSIHERGSPFLKTKLAVCLMSHEI